MIIGGVLLTIVGVILGIVGYEMNNDLDAIWNSFWERGVTDPGTPYLVIGIMLTVIGIILIIVGAVRRNEASVVSTAAPVRQSDEPHPPISADPSRWACVCGTVNPGSADVCQNCHRTKAEGYYAPKTVCPHCGRQTLANQSRCIHCANLLSAPPVSGMGMKVGQTGVQHGLLALSGSMRGASFALFPGKNVRIGRDPQKVQIVTPADAGAVSGVHCQIRYNADSNTFTVTDFSTNGTYLGQERLQYGAERTAVPGMILTLANNSMKLQLY